MGFYICSQVQTFNFIPLSCCHFILVCVYDFCFFQVDIDASEQQWTDIVPKSVTKDLDKKEIKRQQIINELLSTEKHHVRDLRIIEKVRNSADCWFFLRCLLTRFGSKSNNLVSRIKKIMENHSILFIWFPTGLLQAPNGF